MEMTQFVTIICHYTITDNTIFIDLLILNCTQYRGPLIESSNITMENKWIDKDLIEIIGWTFDCL